jgi:hypothetical protein
MSEALEDGMSGLRRVVERLSTKTAMGRGGLGGNVPIDVEVGEQALPALSR